MFFAGFGWSAELAKRCGEVGGGAPVPRWRSSHWSCPGYGVLPLAPLRLQLVHQELRTSTTSPKSRRPLSSEPRRTAEHPAHPDPTKEFSLRHDLEVLWPHPTSATKTRTHATLGYGTSEGQRPRRCPRSAGSTSRPAAASLAVRSPCRPVPLLYIWTPDWIATLQLRTRDWGTREGVGMLTGRR